MRASTLLLDPATRALDGPGVFAAFVEALEDAGVRVSRAATSLRTLHPEIWVLSIRWRRGEGVNARAQPHDLAQSSLYQDSPVARIHAGDDRVRCRLAGPDRDLAFPICRELAAEGATDYVCFAIPFAGPRTFASFATDADGGFTDAQLALLESLLPALSLRLELEAEAHARKALLEVYLGNDAARRVLSGAVRRGRGERLDAVIWTSDLRDFTTISDGVTPEDVVAMLDRTFDCTAGAVLDGGGEVLKFIGDAVLGVFPLGGDAAAACRRALAASRDALSRLDALNAARRRDGAREVRCGIGVHVGEVFYGNVGAGSRLDFTVIGAAVNEAARIESACKGAGVPLLLSEAFVRRGGLDAEVVPAGSQVLKGVARPMELFTLAELAPG